MVSLLICCLKEKVKQIFWQINVLYLNFFAWLDADSKHSFVRHTKIFLYNLVYYVYFSVECLYFAEFGVCFTSV